MGKPDKTNKRSIISPTDAQIINGIWANENPSNRGYNSTTGMYTSFPDPNGKDKLIGPGLKVGSTVEDRPYTRKELDAIALRYGRKSLQTIGDEYNSVYGTSEFPTPWDTVSVAPKLLMQDVRTRTGKLPQKKWPNLYKAVSEGNQIRMLQESRTKFKRDGIEYPDNDRVRRSAETFFPGMFDVSYEKDSWDPVTVTRKKKEFGGRKSLETIR